MRASNTGSLALNVLGKNIVQRILWERKKEELYLSSLIQKNDVALIYPNDKSQLLTSENSYQNFLLLDGTWQETRKIYNRSPYLQKLPHFHLTPKKKSIYTLRKNQKEYGFCTAESISEILETFKQSEQSILLRDSLEQFILKFKR